jgi:DNA-binding transcriptional ArsR family regulator
MQTSPVRRYILNNLSQHQKDIVRAAARKFGLSRQAVLRHMKTLILDGKIEAHGKTRDRYYVLKPIVNEMIDLDLTTPLREDSVGRQYLYPHLGNYPANVREICEYGFSQIMNNVIVHSGGSNCRLRILINDQMINLRIGDDGSEGIFRKTASYYGYSDPACAALELTKGKVTTSPEHHTGEGVFFTTRLFDKVSLASNGLRLKCDTQNNSWKLVELEKQHRGTSVYLTVGKNSDKTVKDIMVCYSSNGEGSVFDRTEVPMRLARIDSETLMSRSQARRVLTGLDQFEEVCFDFKGVPTMGQPFADEIFRVFANENGGVMLKWRNAASEIESMIARIRNHQGNGYKVSSMEVHEA